jgi:CRP-like cAMP-binding protein
MNEPRRTPAQLVELLARVPPFSALDGSALKALVGNSRVQSLPKGTLLFSQHDVSDAVYVVVSGTIALMLSTPDGRELVIDEMKAGTCFGELSALTDKRRSTGAMAATNCDVLSIPLDVFLDALNTQPKLMRQLLAMTAQRLRDCSDRERALAFLDAPGRLARALLLLNKQAGGESAAMVISQEELAQRVGLTRQTVAKELGKWRRAGWLLTGRGKIVLLNIPAIQQAAAAVEW